MGDLRDDNLWSVSLDDSDLQTAFDIILDVPLDGLDDLGDGAGLDSPFQDILDSEDKSETFNNDFFNDDPREIPQPPQRPQQPHQQNHSQLKQQPTQPQHQHQQQSQHQQQHIQHTHHLQHNIKEENNNTKPWKEARVSQFQRSGEMTMEKWQWNPHSPVALDPLDHKIPSRQEKFIDSATVFPPHSSFETFDDFSSSDEEGMARGDKSKRRSNVREHSKAQREKRKAVVMDMEGTAKMLTTQLNDMESLLRSNLEHISFKRSYFHETISAFLSAWCGGDDRIETWQSLVDRQFSEMALPLTSTRYYPPGQIVGGRRILRGLNQVIADASSFSLLCSAITSRGNVPISSFTFSAEVSLKSFVVDVDTAFGSFRIFTKSAVLSGGVQEINLRGFMRCGFSSGGNLQWVDLFYDETDLQNQLILSFSSNVYQGAPNIFQMVTSLHDDNSASPTFETEDDSLVIIETSLSTDLRVSALSPGAIKKIGPIVGRTLISADWVNSAILTLSEYAPYSCVLDSRTENGYQSKILCQIYPFSPERIFQATAAATSPTVSPLSPASPPTKLLWIMTEWTSDDLSQIYRVLQCQLSRLVRFATATHSRHTARTGQSCSNFSSRIAQIEPLASMDIPPNTAVSVRHIVEFMKHFLGWVELLETETWSDETLLGKLGGGSVYSKESAPAAVSTASHKSSAAAVHKVPSPPETEQLRQSHSRSLSQTYTDDEDETEKELPSSLAVCAGWSEYQDSELSLFLLLSAEIDQIFVTIRDSSCCPNILSLLQQTSDREQTQVIETYISFCLTKHTHPRVRFLMKLSQDLIRAQQLEHAVNVLSEIIGLDGTFLEAYNRRATALYGLRRVQECFSDLEYVLKHNPLHYGALCGKGLMLMNLKAYTPAIAAFQTVLHINPLLANSEAILTNIRHCRQYEWQTQAASSASLLRSQSHSHGQGHLPQLSSPHGP